MCGRPFEQHPLVDDESLGTVGEPNAAGRRRELTLEANARRQSREQQAARREHAPQFVEHRAKIALVAREVQHGAADDRVNGGISPGQRIERSAIGVLRPNHRARRRRQPTSRVDRQWIGVGNAQVEAVVQEEGQIPSAAAAGIEHAPPAIESAAKQLVEQIDVDLSELRSEAGGDVITHPPMISLPAATRAVGGIQVCDSDARLPRSSSC